MRLRNLVLAAVFLATLVSPALAVLTGPVVVDCDYFTQENLTVGATAVGLTAGTYNPGGGLAAANCAIIIVEADSVRWLTTGTTATTGNANLAVINDVIVLKNARAIARFSAIRVTTDATLKVNYGRKTN